MRITERMLTAQLLTNLTRTRRRLQDYEDQLSSGMRLTRPSDDPSNLARDLRLRSGLGETKRFLANVDDAVNWMSMTEAALQSVTDALQRARELAVAGGGNAVSQSSLNAIADELEQIFQHLVETGNTHFDGRYLFSGYKTETRPFIPAAGDPPVAYQGDGGLMEREIGVGSTITINLPGDQVFMEAFSTLQKLIDGLRSGSTDRVTARIGELDGVLDQAVSTRSWLGARINRLELVRARLLDTQMNLTRLLSEVEDVDVARTVVELSSAEKMYQVALSVGAKVVQPSLLDFLR